ncbi:MAG: chorismate mutase [Candidatus Bathycorpusculaceae bacterium]
MEKIQQLRKKIDEVDEQILLLLNERVKLCKAIGKVKKEHGIPIKDPLRENKVYQHIRHKASRLELGQNQVETVYREIIAMCTTVQELEESASEQP